MRRGAASESESDAEMRDDKIAEEYGAEESGLEIEDDRKNLEESDDNVRRGSRAGRRRRLVN